MNRGEKFSYWTGVFGGAAGYAFSQGDTANGIASVVVALVICVAEFFTISRREQP